MSEDSGISGEEWLREFCARVGVEPPTGEQARQLLALAATAAHSSERTAAPLACWAAGVSGRQLEELVEIAESIG